MPMTPQLCLLSVRPPPPLVSRDAARTPPDHHGLARGPHLLALYSEGRAWQPSQAPNRHGTDSPDSSLAGLLLLVRRPVKIVAAAHQQPASTQPINAIISSMYRHTATRTSRPTHHARPISRLLLLLLLLGRGSLPQPWLLLLILLVLTRPWCRRRACPRGPWRCAGQRPGR